MQTNIVITDVIDVIYNYKLLIDHQALDGRFSQASDGFFLEKDRKATTKRLGIPMKICKLIASLVMTAS